MRFLYTHKLDYSFTHPAVSEQKIGITAFESGYKMIPRVPSTCTEKALDGLFSTKASTGSSRVVVLAIEVDS